MKNKMVIIAPVFGEYHRIITRTLCKSGVFKKVYFIPEAPLYNLGLFAFISRLLPFLRAPLIKFHNRLILWTITTRKTDLLFIIRGEFIDSSMLEQAKKIRPNIQIITYQWDSIKNNPNAERLIKVSDSAYSFDPIDTTNYPMKYVPLFYCWEECGYNYPELDHNKKPIDFFFVGGYRTSRVEILRAFKRFCEKKGYSYYIKSFERIGSYVKNRKRLNMDIDDVSFKQLSYKSYYHHLLASKYVIDIQSPTQTGLTMRTMEALSLQKKIITTNKYIKQTPLYSESMVFVLNSKNDIDSLDFEHFLKKKVHKVDAVLSLSSWLKQIGVL